MRRADHRIVPVFGTSSIRRPTYPSDETDNANNAVKYRCSTRYRSTTGQVRSNALHRTEPRLLDAFLMNRLAAGFSSQSHGEDVHELQVSLWIEDRYSPPRPQGRCRTQRRRGLGRG